MYGKKATLEINTNRNSSTVPGFSFTWHRFGLFLLARGPSIEYRWFGKLKHYIGGFGWAEQGLKQIYANCLIRKVRSECTR